MQTRKKSYTSHCNVQWWLTIAIGMCPVLSSLDPTNYIVQSYSFGFVIENTYIALWENLIIKTYKTFDTLLYQIWDHYKVKHFQQNNINIYIICNKIMNRIYKQLWGFSTKKEFKVWYYLCTGNIFRVLHVIHEYVDICIFSFSLIIVGCHHTQTLIRTCWFTRFPNFLCEMSTNISFGWIQNFEQHITSSLFFSRHFIVNITFFH